MATSFGHLFILLFLLFCLEAPSSTSLARRLRDIGPALGHCETTLTPQEEMKQDHHIQTLLADRLQLFSLTLCRASTLKEVTFLISGQMAVGKDEQKLPRIPRKRADVCGGVSERSHHRRLPPNVYKNISTVVHWRRATLCPHPLPYRTVPYPTDSSFKTHHFVFALWKQF